MPVNIKFSKYQGTGNDFILIDGRDSQSPINQIDDLAEFAREVCDRHFGIGSDGLIVIKTHASLAFYMDFYNPDGSQSFCGNGSRCAVQYYRTLAACESIISFEAIDGVHEAQIKNDEVAVKMTLITGPFKIGNDVELHTGSPHYIRFVDELPNDNLVLNAREIRYSDRYKLKGINVNFVKRTEQIVEVQTYERGVEGETLSCGTGVTAVALACAFCFNQKSPVHIATKGGELSVQFKYEGSQFSDIFLNGPAQKVYEGIWEN